MADSQYIFNYLNDVWDLLPEQDRVRFAETWKAYEQTYGYLWMQQFDSDLANTVARLPVYNILRWLKHTFNASTKIDRAATFRSAQDLSLGIDLSARYLIRMSVDGGPVTEIDLRGVIPGATTIFEIVDRINLVMGQKIVAPVADNQLIQFTSLTTGPGSSFTFYPATVPANDASALILGLDPDLDLPKTIPKFPYEYLLADKFMVGIPVLQDRIHDELVGTRLTQNADFDIEVNTGIISFAEEPPEVLWAKDTLMNYETPYNNFGYLLDIYAANSPDYLKAVKGLWFAFWSGPRPEYIRRSLVLLFGLPSATKAGVVTSLNTSQATLTYTDGSTETFTLPDDLEWVVYEGKSVEQFEPLTTGVKVFDKVNYPGFLRQEIGRPAVQPFLTQHATRGEDPETDESKALRLLEENTYLPQINVNAFISPNISLSNVRSFLNNIQPQSRSYLFQVLVGVFREALPLKDEGLTGTVTSKWPNGRPSLGFDISFDTTPNLDWNNNTMGNEDTWEEAEDNPFTSLVLDDEVLLFGEFGLVEVYQAAVLIDSFSIEG